MSDDTYTRIAALSARIAAEGAQDASLYFERGKLHWKNGDKGAAMTDFNTAVSLDPDSGARTYLDMAQDVMDFYNTDLYNP